MRSDSQLELAQADSRIAAAERNIRHVEALLPRLSAQGVSTREIESHLGLMTEALHHLKEQRRLIVGAWN
jgi:transposase-like protein